MTPSSMDGGPRRCEGVLQSPTGAALSMRDVYEVAGQGFKVSRTTTVLKNVDDYGFASKVSFVLAASDDVRDYDCFAPGQLVPPKRVFQALQHGL